MGWSIGWDDYWNRFVGYGVIAYCDHPDCNEVIDRGLSYVCGGEPYGGDRGCGLYFCYKHLIMHPRLPQLCIKCSKRLKPYKPKLEHPEWINHILTHKSWDEWRKENPNELLSLISYGKYKI